MYPRIDICGYPQIFTDMETDSMLWSVKSVVQLQLHVCTSQNFSKSHYSKIVHVNKAYVID